MCEDGFAETKRSGQHGANDAGSWTKGQYTANRGGTSTGGHASGGFSPGQAAPAYEPDPTIPHWDRVGHFRTQESIRKRHSEMAARAKAREEEIILQVYRQAHSDTAGGIMVRFSAVLGCIMFVMAASGWVVRKRDSGWGIRDDG